MIPPLRLLPVLWAASLAPFLDAAAPVAADRLPVSEIRAGMQGEVWTVFQGTTVEPFTVEVTGVLHNGLGPGKDLIICRLTDPRVQASGAVAGMSGSPLYLEGKLAGALSYQLQRFETVRYAGFTPIADMLEVGRLPPAPLMPVPLERAGVPGQALVPLQPVFALSGVSPAVAALFQPRLAALGLEVVALGGSLPAPAADTPRPATPFRPGDAVSVALATGDVTLAATGTVSLVEGERVLAFGHPMLSLGDVELPMATAEIVTILPSQLNSVKVSNTGAIVGTISQDRLSGVFGEVGRAPEMIPVRVSVRTPAGARELNFAVARHPLLSPQIAALGVAQAALAWNAAGQAQGYRVEAELAFPGAAPLLRPALYSGAGGLAQGLNDLAQELGGWLGNPVARVYPERMDFTVTALPENPTAVVDQFRLERARVAPGEVLRVAIAWRDFQGESRRSAVEIPIPAAWAGRELEVVLADGATLDGWSGKPRTVAPAQFRSFDRLVEYARGLRPAHGLTLAVVEKGVLLADQHRAALDVPGSVERIARAADETRFDRRDAVVPLWETRLLEERIVAASFRRPLTVLP